MRTAVLSFALALQALAGEYAVLQNGFRMYADRHEALGDVTRLHTESGTVDLPSKDITRFEVEECVRPKPEPAPAPQAAAPVVPLPTPKELIHQAATVHGLRPEFVQSVAAVESAYQPKAVSPKGAIGLMQLMPGTAQELGVDPHDPAQNAEAGARYLKQLLEKYAHTKDPVRLALAAYNAGPGAVDKYRSIPPYRETQDYVERVLRRYLIELKAKAKS